MKIKKVEVVDFGLTEFKAEQRKVWDKNGRRPPWSASGPVANPMTPYPRYSAYRPSWMPPANSTANPSAGVLVTADDGSQGFSVFYWADFLGSIISDYLGPRIQGEPAMATEKIYDMMVRLCAPFGASGLASYAVSAIDLALWDLKGKVLDKPVYELIGGPQKDFIKCYPTGGDVDGHMELGFPATKLPCPYGPHDGLDGLHKNVELIAATREIVGQDIEIMLDCWMAFDVEYTVKLAERLRPYQLSWIEETLRPEEFSAHQELRRRLPWQILATGEHWYTTKPFFEAARSHVADILQPDIGWVGGLTPLIKICAIAEAAGLSVVPHGGAITPYGQHAIFSMPAVRWGEYYIGSPPGVSLADAVLMPGVPYAVDGKLIPSDAPGFGVALKPENFTIIR